MAKQVSVESIMRQSKRKSTYVIYYQLLTIKSIFIVIYGELSEIVYEMVTTVQSQSHKSSQQQIFGSHNFETVYKNPSSRSTHSNSNIQQQFYQSNTHLVDTAHIGFINQEQSKQTQGAQNQHISNGDFEITRKERNQLQEIKVFKYTKLITLLQTYQHYYMDKREQNLHLAKIAEQCERYEDMVKYLKKIIELSQDLTEEERNLFSIAYKNVTASRRTAWRAISAFEVKEQNKNSRTMETVRMYKTKIQKQLNQICNEVIAVIDKLLKKNPKAEARIFYFKMKGDYHRYLCQHGKGDFLSKNTTSALAAYNEALQLADKQNIVKTSPLKLGVYLNLSVFYYEIANDLKKAIECCEKGFTDSSNCLNDINDQEFKDTTTIMQLMYDNLMSWKGQEN